MFESTTTVYAGSIAELQGCPIVAWSACYCARCAWVSADRLNLTVEANGVRVNLAHARRESMRDLGPMRPVDERCGELLALLKA